MKRIFFTLVITLGPGLGLGGCVKTKVATHVEVVDRGGEKTYVAGAHAPGVSQTVACRGAVRRSVSAISLRFLQDFEDLGDDIAKAVGASDGAAILQRYATDAALDGAIQDIKFDPGKHACLATVSWTPPVFLKDAVVAYAQGLREQEGASRQAPIEESPAASSRGSSSSSPAVSGPAPIPANPPSVPAPSQIQPAKPEPAAPPPPACIKARAGLKKVIQDGEEAAQKFAECLRRTGDDETICHRYRLRHEEAEANEGDAGRDLVACLNAELALKIRDSLRRHIPGHAAVPVETRDGGNLLLFTYSPLEHTGFAYEMNPDGGMVGTTPLNAEQTTWIRQRLGL